MIRGIITVLGKILKLASLVGFGEGSEPTQAPALPKGSRGDRPPRREEATNQAVVAHSDQHQFYQQESVSDAGARALTLEKQRTEHTGGGGIAGPSPKEKEAEIGTYLSQLPWSLATGLIGTGMPGLRWPHQGVLGPEVYIERRAQEWSQTKG